MWSILPGLPRILAVDPTSEPWLRLLQRLREGSQEAAAQLFEQVHADLHARAARAFRSQRRDHTLSPTALVNEAYLKLMRPGAALAWQDRLHFLNVATRAMRQVLINHARERHAGKRGGGLDRQRITLDGVGRVDDTQTDVEALQRALEALEELDARQAQIADLRLLGGLTVAEVAELLDVSKRTVETDWRMAKDFLSTRLGLRPAATD